MIKRFIILAACASSLLVHSLSSVVAADLVSIQDRHFADRSTILGRFVPKSNNQVVFVFTFGGIHGVTHKVLLEDEWDWEKIRKGLLEITEYIETRDTIVIFEMLREVGFTPKEVINKEVLNE